ncbi:MAG: hypothetical protein ACQPRJ_04870 [Solitalea-like symbiont of Acarus siro]
MPYKTQTNKNKPPYLYLFRLSTYSITIFCYAILIVYTTKCIKYNLKYTTVQSALDLFLIGFGLGLVFEIIINKYLFNYRGSSQRIPHKIFMLKHTHSPNKVKLKKINSYFIC